MSKYFSKELNKVNFPEELNNDEFPILQRLDHLVAEDWMGPPPPYPHPKGHDLKKCADLAQQLSEDEFLLMGRASKDLMGDELGWWLESNPHMGQLKDLTDSFWQWLFYGSN